MRFGHLLPALTFIVGALAQDEEDTQNEPKRFIVEFTNVRSLHFTSNHD